MKMAMSPEGTIETETVWLEENEMIIKNMKKETEPIIYLKTELTDESDEIYYPAASTQDVTEKEGFQTGADIVNELLDLNSEECEAVIKSELDIEEHDILNDSYESDTIVIVGEVGNSPDAAVGEKQAPDLEQEGSSCSGTTAADPNSEKGKQTATVVTVNEQRLVKERKGVQNSFSRELQKIKNTPSGAGASSQRNTTMMYYDELSFLPITASKRTTSNDKLEDGSCDALEDTSIATEVSELVTVGGSEYSGPPPSKRTKNESCEEQLLTSLCKSLEKQAEVKEDEERHFLLSLIPEFKKVKSDRRMDCKMEIMSVIRRYQIQKPLHNCFGSLKQTGVPSSPILSQNPYYNHGYTTSPHDSNLIFSNPPTMENPLSISTRSSVESHPVYSFPPKGHF